MSLPRSVIDGFLVDWEEGEYKAQVEMMRQKSQALTAVVTVPAGAGSRHSARTAQRAQAVRDRVGRTVRKVPEVMVKIYSSCRGMKQVGRHIDYISRKGQIDLEDQDGMILRGQDRLKDLKDEWRIGGLEEIAEDSTRRDTLNIVFSMPAHTDEVAMKRAVRAFAQAEFKGHQYVWAYHTQATDPDPDPPAHPHVHLSVKTLGLDGRRLNPRKADLQRWREGFAAELRAHGIEANATSRLARLQRERGTTRTVLAVAEKGEALHTVGKRAVDADRQKRAAKLEDDRTAYYAVLRYTLARSEDPADRALAQDIGDHFLKGVGGRDLSGYDLKPGRRDPAPDR